MVAHLAWGSPTTWGTLAVAASLAATAAHGAPASDRLGRGDELDALAVLLHGQGQESYGPRIVKRQLDAPPVVTQTVFSTYVQTAKQTLFTTVSPTQGPGYGATPSSPDAAIQPSLVPIAPASPAPVPTDSSSDAQSTSSSSPGAGPVLFMPPGQPDLSTPTLMPSSGAENNKPPAPSPAPSKPPPSQQKPLMMAYYPEWAAGTFPPEKVDFQRYDWVDFAFAVPQQDFSLGWDGSDDAPDLLRRLVASAHNSGKKAKLSVGGWTGSKYFSSAVSTAQSRQTLASSILAAYNQFKLDGIEIDWEYPAQAGNEQNNVSPVDTGNYLLFLQLLRRTLPPTAKITAATMTVPWADARGNPLRDVSGFAKVLDWILIMNYDTWGSSANPGPNAPLSNGCHNSTQSGSSAVAGVATWTAAGFPASKIVMGMPSYGYISRSSASYLQTRSVSGARLSRRSLEHVPMHTDGSSGITADSGIPPVQSAGDDSGLDISAAGTNGARLVMNEDGGTADGQVQFRGLIKQGILQYIPAWSTSSATVQSANAMGSDDGEGDADEGSDGSSTPDADADVDATINTLSFAGHTISNVFTALSGFERKWDACSSTPYLRSASAQQVVSYDDPQSLEMKATYARYAGLLGVNMFDIHGDTDQWDLTDALRRGLGL